MSAARLFIALWPDDAVRHELAQRRDAWSWPRSASPVKTERLHVTLHFLGDVERDLIPHLADALAVPFDPFSLTFGRHELWGRGIAVLEPDIAPPALMHLHLRLGKALEGAGMALDTRPFRPHVTLARRAGRTAPPAPSPGLLWQVKGYRLMESTGGAYVTLRSHP